MAVSRLFSYPENLLSFSKIGAKPIFVKENHLCFPKAKNLFFPNRKMQEGPEDYFLHRKTI